MSSNVIQVTDSAPGLSVAQRGYRYLLYLLARAYLMGEPGMASIIRSLETSPTVYKVVLNVGQTTDVDPFEPTVARWDPNAELACSGGGFLSPALGLGHEMAHLLGGPLPRGPIPARYDDAEEFRVITGPERKFARAMGGECMRDDHSSPWIKSPKHLELRMFWSDN
jgi:hypothetical protein